MLALLAACYSNSSSVTQMTVGAWSDEATTTAATTTTTTTT